MSLSESIATFRQLSRSMQMPFAGTRRNESDTCPRNGPRIPAALHSQPTSSLKALASFDTVTTVECFAAPLRWMANERQ
jgi:hypothetical protein